MEYQFWRAEKLFPYILLFKFVIQSITGIFMQIHLLLGKDLPNKADAMDRLCDMSSSSKNNEENYKKWKKIHPTRD